MTRFRKQLMLILGAAAVLLSAGTEAHAQGISVLKMGWTYAITFPEVADPQVSGYNRPEGGMHLYRVLQFGGDQWYRLQRVYKKPEGGWFSVPNTEDTWVNIGYAFSIREITK